jgi:inhibitor of KinA sporulation pathway (predicted exonuclease)
MEYTILDLEWNSTFAPKIGGYLNEIIQFGAVRLDSRLQVIDTYDTFVRPQTGRITRLVTELTNITDNDVKNGLLFMDAFRRFCRFAQDSVILTWSDGDLRELISNYRYYTGKTELPIRARYADLQDYCQSRMEALPAGRQLGLADAAVLLGLDPEAFALHRAIDDSLLSAECLRRTFDEAALAARIVPMDTELYRKLTFKARFITDRSDPLIDPAQFDFVCPLCGGALAGKEDWGLHNRQFFRRFVCRGCGKKLKARVQFKEKYEGVQVKRNIQEDLPKPVPVAAEV